MREMHEMQQTAQIDGLFFPLSTQTQTHLVYAFSVAAAPPSAATQPVMSYRPCHVGQVHIHVIAGHISRKFIDAC